MPLLQIFRSDAESPDFWIHYDEGVNFVVRENVTRISVDWSESLAFEDAVTYLLGPVMAFLLQLRGTTCLHGSAVAINGHAVVLAGPQGAGKSTTAAALARAGYPVIADDLILLTESAGRLMVEPSYPVLRLWPESVTHIFGSEDALPRISPLWNKRGFNVRDVDLFQIEALPLMAVYFLCGRTDEESAPRLNPVAGAESLVRLVANSWGHYVAKPAILSRQLTVLTRLSRTVRLAELIPHANAARLSALCELIVSTSQ